MKRQNIVTVGIFFLAVYFVQDIWGFTGPQLIDVDTSGATIIKTVCSTGCDYDSLSAAASAAQAGWRIRVKAGTYSGFDWPSSRSGTANNPIVVEAYEDGKVYINGGMQFNGEYIIVDGKGFSSPQIVFDGKGLSDRTIIFGYDHGAAGNHITLYRSEITGGLFSAIVTQSNYNKIYNCLIHDTGTSHAIYLSNCAYCEVKNNIIRTFGKNGIQSNPHDSNNKILDTDISGNAIYDCGENGLTVLSGTGLNGLLDGLTITNNLIWGCSQNAMRFTGSGDYVGIIKNVSVYGNTFYGSIDNNHGVNGKDATTKFKNNIVTGSVNNTGGFIEYSNNVIGLTSCLASTASSSSDFLKLKSGASCINAGATGLGLAMDYFGNTRDSQPDIGAHEYGGGAPPDTTLPAAPKGVTVR